VTRRLIVCFDGTWNTLEDRTNVARIYAAVADAHANCPDQRKFYDPGVGTTRGSRLTGGALGWGLDRNILEGLCWLINEYPAAPGLRAPEADGEVFADGPDIFIFGFSRGAYTARSLAGLMNRCGLPRREPREEAAHPDSSLVRRAWALYRASLPGGRDHPDCVAFRREHAWNVTVKCLGVWDTVGALGVPMLSNTPLSRLRYGFHDTRLGRIVEHAYHAVAIDEHREDYRPTLWDADHPVGTRDVEQRWFPGAHANVGGGYDGDPLPGPPLAWIAEKARALGLEFTDEFAAALGRARCVAALPASFALRGDEHLAPLRDSYAEFLYGLYRLGRRLIFRGRYWRPMLRDGVGETVDETAWLRWAADPSYRPPNLAEAGRPVGSVVSSAPTDGLHRVRGVHGHGAGGRRPPVPLRPA
jgi:hypothetical protein